MFGVLTPCRHALDDELMDQWRSHLCGVCLSLRNNHGQTSRLTVNTDAVMVSILTAAQSSAECASTEAGRCPLRGMRTATVVSADEPGVRLAATTSLTLAAAKATDVSNEQDHALAPRTRLRAGVAGRAGRYLRRRAGTDTAVAAGLDVDGVLTTLARQAEVESSSRILDDLTSASADAAAQVFSASAMLAGVPGNRDALESIGADFGRIAHLLDAVDDYDSDDREGRFNPLRATGTPPAAALDDCRRLAATIRKRYADLTLVDDRLLRVVLLDGLRHAIHKRMHRETDPSMPVADSRTQWPPHRPFGYPAEWPYPPPFKPDRAFHERLLPFLGVSCLGKACCVDHWNHCTDKYKVAACDDCNCCDCCDCCDL
ncbi:DUF5685 family protein [Gordonia sp. 'Campus']|uniref:DUF5685 family protein n=1 Tax=Gordonia sp. 'Campus' TaxID=2915824 RepID=UPI001EE48FA4|nr:DUF5685 family protein [Gordonia sp. 'Campus']